MTPTTYRFGRFHLQPQTRQLLVDGRGTDVDALGLDVQLTGQTEQLNERLSG